MIIRKINIASFGTLSDFSADLSNGLNVISGSNESGKSTILAFIRFVLYGLPSRRSEEGVLEYDRALSWLDGRAEGSIEIECEKGANILNVINCLFKETDLQTSISYNQVALIDKDIKIVSITGTNGKTTTTTIIYEIMHKAFEIIIESNDRTV